MTDKPLYVLFYRTAQGIIRQEQGACNLAESDIARFKHAGEAGILWERQQGASVGIALQTKGA
jgi:hypothetical protein